MISSLLSLLCFDCITLSAYNRNLIHNAVVLGATKRRPNGKEVMKTQSQEENTTATNGVGSVTGFFFSGFLSHSFAHLFSVTDFARRLDSRSIF